MKHYYRIIACLLTILIIMNCYSSNVNAQTNQVTERVVFYQFPQELSNPQYDRLYSLWYEDCANAMETVTAGEQSAAIFMEVLCKGGEYIGNEVGSLLGVSDDNVEKNNKEVAYEVLKNYMVNYFIDTDTSKEIQKQWEDAADILGIASTALDFSKEVDKQQAKSAIDLWVDFYEDEELEILFSDGGVVDKLSATIDIYNDAEDFNKVLFTALELAQMDSEAIDDLLSVVDSGSDLYRALLKIRRDIDKDKVKYVLDNYFSNYAIEKISKAVTKYSIKAILTNSDYLILKVIKQVSYFAFKKTNVTVTEYHHAIILYSYTRDVENALMDIQEKFRYKNGNDEDIRKYKNAYGFYLSCFSKYIEYSQKLVHKHWLIDQRSTNEKRLDNKLEMYLDTINGMSYDQFINNIIRVVQKKVDNKEYTIKDNNEIEVHDVNGNVIDDNYDSTETIRSKLEAIQKEYKPNVGQKWISSYKGSSECNGFARMVFYMLYGYDITGYLGYDRSVLQNEKNVVKVGQLKKTDVTKDNLKTMFSKAKIGDFLQVCGSTYGQHSAIILGVDDGGVTVYDCNWSLTEYCIISIHKFTWDNLVSLYSKPYVVNGKEIPNGVSIYRANNYSLIYDDGNELFYDDSVNFVIENGVLVKYNGWQSYVVIPDEVTEIGYEAFANNSTMKGVEIPESVKKIDEYAFRNCSELLSIFVPDSVEEIGMYAFSECSKLLSVHLPDNDKYTSIENGLFSEDISIKSIDLPEKITTIKDYAFYRCQKIESVEIAEFVTKIEYAAFYECKNLSNVKLPSELVELGAYAFYDCDSIESIEIPRTLSKASASDWNGPFSQCDGLKEVSFEDGCSKIPNYLFAGCTGIENIEVPENVTNIEYGAFGKCSNLAEISMPDTVSKIGDSAFYECGELSNVQLPSELIELGAYAFYDCDKIERIIIPKSLDKAFSSDWNGPFSKCDGLKNITFEEGCTKIVKYIFSGCTGLEEISIPNSVTTIEDGAFGDCINLQTINIPDSVKTIKWAAFRECTSLKSIEIPKDLINFTDANIFEGCTSLESISLPEKMNNIPTGTFSGCKSLKSIDIPDGIEYVGESAFRDCDSLTEVFIPDSVEDIYSYAFADCDNLESITTSSNDLNYMCFSNCGSLKNITLKNGVRNIYDSVFEECDSIENIVLPDSLKRITDRAFYSCDELKYISFGAGIKEIPPYCFYECRKLNSVILPLQITKISEFAFGNCTGLTDMVINRNVTSIADNFAYYKKLTIHGVVGTYAETFANNNSIPFAALSNPATGIKLSSNELKLSIGDTEQLTASIIPSDSMDELTWTSTDDDVVTVDADGNIEAIASGNASIIAMAGNVIEICKIEVYKAVTEVYLNYDNYEGTVGDTFDLIATVYPEDATTKTVKWTSSNSDVASVDENGTVKLNGFGTADITVTTDDMNKSSTCTVTVKAVGVTGVTLSDKKIEIDSGAKYTLVATVSPDNAENKDVTWTSSNPGIATVDGGVVTGVSEGTTIIIVKTVDGSKTASCTVKVSNKVHVHNWDDGVITKEPTCSEMGIKTFTCSGCGITKTEDIDKTEHTPVVDNAVDATCTEYGLSEGTHCSVCNAIIEQQTIVQPFGHDWDDGVITKEVTENEDGERLYTCRRCNITRTETILAHGHQWDEGVVTREATCTEEGEILYTCLQEGCGETRIETTDPKGHVLEVDEAKEPKCTESGLTEGLHCSECNAVIVEQKVVAPLGHKTEKDQAVKATYTSTGLTEGSHCSVCHEILCAQEIVPCLSGLYKSPSDGKLYYMSDGKVNDAFTGIAQYKKDRKWYFVRDGVFDSTYNGLDLATNGHWYYCTNGLLDKSFNGQIAPAINGKKYYVRNGSPTASFTEKIAYCPSDNTWYYCTNGKPNMKASGIIAHATDGNWYYVTKGKIDKKYTGVAKATNGTWYYCKKGVMDDSFTGVAKATDGSYKYVSSGKYNTKYKGLAKFTSGSTLYYVKNGTIDRTFTGKCKYNGKTYNVVKGVAK